MWGVWTAVISETEKQDFETQLEAYFKAFGVEKVKEIVSELYKQKDIKKTNLEKKYYFLAKTADIHIDHSMVGTADSTVVNW